MGISHFLNIVKKKNQWPKVTAGTFHMEYCPRLVMRPPIFPGV